MFYKSKKVLLRLIFASTLSGLGILSIIIGLLCKFVFSLNNVDTSDIILLALSIFGCLSLFLAFILVLVNQIYLQNINNNLLKENKKEWEKQLNKELNDPNNDFVLADENVESNNVEEDEIININIINDNPILENNIQNSTPKIIVNNCEEEKKLIVENVDENIGISEQNDSKNTFIKINNEEKIIDVEPINEVENVSSNTINVNQSDNLENNAVFENKNVQEGYRNIHILPRTIENQQINLGNNSQKANRFVIPPRTSSNLQNPNNVVDQQRIIPRLNSRNLENTKIPEKNTTLVNNQGLNQQQRPIPPRSTHIPQRPIHIPPKV